MNIYSRYIVYSLLLPLLVITFTLTGIVWLTQSLRFIDLIVNKGLDVSTFLYLSMLLVPSLLFIILPVALLISVLMVYNRFINDSELIVLKSAGLSRIDLAKPALVVASIIAFAGYFISFYLLPSSYGEFKNTQAFIRNNYASALLQEGVFTSPTKGLTVYIDARGKEGLLEGIFVHDARNPEKPVTMMAEQGRLVRTPSGPRFELVQGNRQEIDKEHGNLSVLYFDSYPLDLSVYTDEAGRDTKTPEERYINELFFPDDVDERIKGKFIAEGHYRLSWPLYSFVFAFVALATLFSGQFNRRGQWKRIAVATAISVVLVLINLGLKSAASSNVWMAIFMYLNIIVSGGVGYYVLITNRIINNIPFVSMAYKKVGKFIKTVKPKIKKA